MPSLFRGEIICTKLFGSIGGLTVGVNEHAAYNGTASSAKTMVNTLKNSLGAGTQVRRSVVRYVAATRGPHSGMGYPLNEFEGQNPPWRRQPRYIQETEHVTA